MTSLSLVSGDDEPLYRHDPQEFVGVPTPTIIYVGVKDRADFDKIALPLQDTGENDRGHVLVKTLGTLSGVTPTVIFQHWVKSPTTAGYRALAAKAAASKGGV